MTKIIVFQKRQKPIETVREEARSVGMLLADFIEGNLSKEALLRAQYTPQRKTHGVVIPFNGTSRCYHT